MPKSGATKTERNILTAEPNVKLTVEQQAWRMIAGEWPPELEQQALIMPDSLYLYPPAIQRNVVAVLACAGTPIQIMCVFLRMNENAFRDTFGEIMANAANVANGRVIGSLFNTAIYEKDPRARTTAAIFWLKCRAQWREDGKQTTDDKEKLEAFASLANFNDEELEKIERIVRGARNRDIAAANNPSKLLEHEDTRPPSSHGEAERGGQPSRKPPSPSRSARTPKAGRRSTKPTGRLNGKAK